MEGWGLPYLKNNFLNDGVTAHYFFSKHKQKKRNSSVASDHKIIFIVLLLPPTTTTITIKQFSKLVLFYFVYIVPLLSFFHLPFFFNNTKGTFSFFFVCVCLCFQFVVVELLWPPLYI